MGYETQATMILAVDPQRMFTTDEDRQHGTGIYVRAIAPGDRWGSYDIAELTEGSLREWLSGLDKESLIRTVAILLGHG